MKTLDEIYAEFIKKAAKAGYKEDELVFGEGKTGGVVFVGEAPGREEAEQRRPFVGKAGRILDGLLLRTGLAREELFVTNTVKFRPYKISAKGTISNRPPSSAEIAFCAECLLEELCAVSPALIVTLGNTPLKAVTGDSASTIGSCHGRIMTVNGRRLFAMYHPASMIYNPSLEQVFENDLKILASIV